MTLYWIFKRGLEIHLVVIVLWYGFEIECPTFAPATTLILTLTLILILILTLPRTKNPIITLTLTICCPRYGRSKYHRSKCWITLRLCKFVIQSGRCYCVIVCVHAIHLNELFVFCSCVCAKSQSCWATDEQKLTLAGRGVKSCSMKDHCVIWHCLDWVPNSKEARIQSITVIVCVCFCFVLFVLQPYFLWWVTMSSATNTPPSRSTPTVPRGPWSGNTGGKAS